MPAMPNSPYAILLILTDAGNAAVCSALGIPLLDVKAYVLADEPPRPVWGFWSSRSFTDAIWDAIETPSTGVRASFPDCTFIKYNRTNAPDQQWPKIVPANELATDRSGDGQHPPLTTSATA